MFRQLDEATRQPGVPFFPQFKDLSDEYLLDGASRILLDVHVESLNGKLAFATDTR